MERARTILHIEDNPVLLMAYRRRLMHEGFSVVSTKDGLEALNVLLWLVPDLVVLDLMLPKFDGGEVLKFIRANPCLKNVPVIILSTYSLLEIADDHVLESADRRFAKDQCTFPMLLQAIKELLPDTPTNDNALVDGQTDTDRLLKTASRSVQDFCI